MSTKYIKEAIHKTPLKLVVAELTYLETLGIFVELNSRSSVR